MELTTNLRHEGDVAVISFAGEIDAFTAPVLRDAISKSLAAGDRRLICDLTEVGFLDSTGLGVLVGRLKAVRMLKGVMRVVIASPRVRRNFEITGLENIFRIDATLEESLAAMG